MRSAITMALVLIGLQVVLATPLAGVTGAAAVPGQLAAAWMSPFVPLIPAKGTAPQAPAAPAAPPAPQAPPGGGRPALNTAVPPPASPPRTVAHL